MADFPQSTTAPRLAGRQPVLEMAAVVLGALTFVWGFLDWFGTSDGSVNGYRLVNGYVPIAFALVAALLAGINLFPNRTERTAWLAIGTSFLGVVFTVVAMTVKPTLLTLIEGLSGLGGEARITLSIQYGLILMLVSVVLQFLCLVAAWLFATGRVSVAGRQPRVAPAPVAPGGPPMPPAAPPMPPAAPPMPPPGAPPMPPGTQPTPPTPPEAPPTQQIPRQAPPGEESSPEDRSDTH